MKTLEVVAAVITAPDGRILCLQRGPTRYAYTSYKYEFPGGKIEPGESPEAALRRELLEELALGVEVGRRVADVWHTYPDFRIHLQAFRCTVAHTAFVRREHVAHCWLTAGGLSALDWAAADRPVVRALQAEAPAP